MEVTTIITAAISALGGGVLSRLLTAKKDNFQTLFDQLQKDNDRLRLELQKDREMIDKLNKKVNQQAIQIMLLESAHNDHPFPMWLKGVDGEMLSINPAYEDVFLAPRGKSMGDYIGQNDYNVWPKEIADKFWQNDLRVIRTRKTWRGREDIMNAAGGIEQWNIIKYPRFSGRTIIGIAGMAFPIDFGANSNNEKH